MRETLGRLTLLFIILVSSSVAQSQSSNPCGVKAVLTPAATDSVILNNGTVTFQSASINATAYRIIINGQVYAMNTPVSTVFAIGLSTVKLVAYNGNCTDTTVAGYLNPGQQPLATDNPRMLYGNAGGDHAVTGLIRKTGGGYVIAGRSVYDGRFQQNGLLIKTRETGCIDWAQKLPGNYPTDIKIIKEAADGGIFVSVLVSVIEQYQVAKLDAAGNVLWTRILSTSFTNVLRPSSMDATPDGGVVIVGLDNFAPGPIVTRLDAGGNIVWQKQYSNSIGGDYRFNDILCKGDAIYVSGTADYNVINQFAAFVIKMDFATGATTWLKKYTTATGTLVINEIINGPNGLMVNFTAPTGLVNTPAIAGLMQLDTSGNVQSSTLVAEQYTPDNVVGPYNTAGNRLVQSGNSFYFLSAGSLSLTLQPLISYETKLVKVDATGKFLWVQKSGGYMVPRFFYPAAAPDEGIAIAGTEIGHTLAPDILGNHLTLKIADSAGGNAGASCYFNKQPFVVVPLAVVMAPFTGTSAFPSFYVSNTSVFPTAPFYPEMRFSCPDYVDSCSYLKITGPRSVCNLAQDYQFNTLKNKACQQSTRWRVSPGVQIVSQTGNSLILRFTNFGRHVVYGENPYSCVPAQDSIVVTAASGTSPLNLGPDISICAQNTSILHAGKAYLLYEWQDGSTDSLFTVKQPGVYWVKVTDSCNNILRDTIVVSLSSSVPLSAGPDRTKCNNDTLHLQASPGFLNYTWSPSYAIDNVSAQQVIVNPVTDTIYTVKAEKTAGCFGYDTVSITVNRSIPIYLGTDTSFCSGDSIVLNAGPGFQRYLWNNGSTLQQLTSTAAGVYSVVATSAAGCASYDTLTIVSLFPHPAPVLDKDSLLCTGTIRVLQPGNFADYLWQDGSTNGSYVVAAPGTYFVSVTDNHQCRGSDTVKISRLVPPPSGFLASDTSICNYGKLELKPSRPYSKYEWSTGSASAAIVVSRPGVYWLQATDKQQCTGRDSLTVLGKDCMLGLYVPSAFSPNRDGKNDLFKPLLFGDIKNYHFTIYNRWAQKVFDSSSPGEGWDGGNTGRVQNNNVFVWICIYQLAGQEQMKASGTVVLVR